MTTLTLEIPHDLAEQARRAGLLSGPALVALLEEAVQWREHDAHADAIRAALIDGEQSGQARPFDATAFRQRMLADG